MRSIKANTFGNEIKFEMSRSSGPGGQNVNKVNSRVTLRFDINRSAKLSTEEKELLLAKLSRRLSSEGVLILSSQEKRSQLQNKEAVIRKFEEILAGAFVSKKIRKATKPSKNSVQQRIKTKKQIGEKKKWRQKPV